MLAAPRKKEGHLGFKRASERSSVLLQAHQRQGIVDLTWISLALAKGGCSFPSWDRASVGWTVTLYPRLNYESSLHPAENGVTTSALQTRCARESGESPEVSQLVGGKSGQ